MGYLGLVKLGQNLTVYCNTHTPSTGAAVAADAVPTVRVYEDTTTAPILTANLAAHDAANVTGFYSAQLAITSGNGFEAGKSYCARIRAVVATVAGAEIHQFDVTTRLADDLAFPTTSGRSIDVESTGEVGLDFNNIKAATGATTLTNITVPTVTTVAAGVTLADDAITSAKFDESTAYPIKSADIGATQIARVGADGDTLETLSDQMDTFIAGSAPTVAQIRAEVWGNTVGERSITQTPAQVIAALTGTDIVMTCNDTFNQSITSLGSLTGYTKLWFTVKTRKECSDTEALIMLLLTIPADDADGLQYINGAVAVTAANGALTIVDTAAGNINVRVEVDEVQKLNIAGNIYYDVQGKNATDIKTLRQGKFYTEMDVTKAIT